MPRPLNVHAMLSATAHWVTECEAGQQYEQLCQKCPQAFAKPRTKPHEAVRSTCTAPSYAGAKEVP